LEDPALADAKRHFDRGKELYKSGAYDQAILEFKSADQIKPSPILAYNIGLAYEKLGRCRAAIGFFERYLREQPDADNANDTQVKIADQRAKMARNECARQPGVPVVTGPGVGQPGPGVGQPDWPAPRRHLRRARQQAD
jgi:tetratricopeptide (TPR) repeat protein